MNIFDMNGPVMSALRKASDVVICNVLFCLLCIPIVTAGAGLTALNASMQVLAADDDDEEDNAAIRTFGRTFKSKFVRSTNLWLICLAIIIFLGAYYWVTSRMTGVMFTMYRITFFVLAFIFAFGFIYIWPLEARMGGKVKETLKNAYLLSAAQFPWTLLALAIPAGLIYVVFFMNPNGYRIGIFLWAVCGFGVCTYLDSFIFIHIFKKMGIEVKTRHSQTTEREEGAIFTDEEHQKAEDEKLSMDAPVGNPDWNYQPYHGGKDDAADQKSGRRGRKNKKK